MKNLNFMKFFYGFILVMISTAFVSCSDDDDDSEAPYLTVEPATLTFGIDGLPVTGSQSSFIIKTNRAWRAVVKDADKSWITLSATEGEGEKTIEVSIPANTTNESTVSIELYNKVGAYLSKAVTIKAGDGDTPIEPTGKIIYNETFGAAGNTTSPYVYVDAYTDWVKTGEGIANVDYAGYSASLRQSGSLSQGYPNASGLTKLFFGGANNNFVINKIALTSEQVNLRLTFGGVYYNYDAKDNVFKPESFHFYLSADGANWTDAIAYTTVPALDNWVYATSDFTLKAASSTLYIKFVADVYSSFAIDDPTLSEGQGGTVVDLGGAVTPTTPAITAAAPTSLSFDAAGGTKDVVLTVANKGSETLSATGLTGILSAVVDDATNTVTVTATANSATTAVSQTLSVTLTNGNTFTVPVTVAGTSSTGDVSTISIDFATLANYPAGFPTKKATSTNGTYSFGGYDFTFNNGSAADGGFYSNTYSGVTSLIFGKKDAYIEFPAVSGKKLVKVSATTADGASVAISVGVLDANSNVVAGGEEVQWSQDNGQLEYVYNLTGTTNDTKYRLAIPTVTKKNAQLTKLVLDYE